MSWLIYGAVGFVLYKLAQSGQLTVGKTEPAKPKKKKKKKKKKPTTSPHEVLGVAPDASESEIRHAYQELMRKYHPDRVANAADELRDLAHKRSKEINAAYDQLRQS